MRRKLPVVLAAGALMLATPLAAQAEPTPDASRFQEAPTGAVKVDSSFTARGTNPNQLVKAIIELKDEPVAVVEAQQGRKFSSSERKQKAAQLKASQQGVVKAVQAKGGKVQTQMQSAYNGVSVTVKRKDVATLAAVPGVVAIHAPTVQKINNATSVPFLGAPKVWQDTGFLGQGVKVAVIDTGIDYTHADFGGPGTVAAYQQAKANSAAPADPSLFGPQARVKGGIDLVGDDYNADDPVSVAKPDPNPLDCQGHGSHVAGTIGGGGVTEDGKAYTGPYDAATGAKAWRVGPGVAPKVDLYAVRVFGCEGTTNVTTEGIDWAVANGMDVINMSLGSTYGQSDDTSAVAASNAAAAGIIVVASAGNSGPNPYMVGSPSVGKGVISVAANDSTQSFPGATLTSGSTVLDAINANGAVLPTTPFTVVVLKDDPATAENEALGCSIAAYTKNGISADPNAPAQIAVTVRGTCARAARPFFGQQAGADAVLMINNATDYPPFEGKITDNPDDGTPLDVTIPFLGVRSTDAAAVKALDGQTLTLAAKPLANPGFRTAASFSSGGAGSGDSSMRPGVTAPGVSIASAGVGTGNGSATLSGTSMAAPHVAGVAALAVQSHPGWTGQQLTNLLVSTADAKGLADYSTVIEGNGLIDLAQSVSGTVYATGDKWRANGDTFREPQLSFGFAEVGRGGYFATKTIQLVNKGTSAQTFTLSSSASPDSLPAQVSVSPSKVTVRAGATVSVQVRLSVQQKDVPGSLADADDQYNFHTVSGRVVATSASQQVSVPYLMVPRSSANVELNAKGKLDAKKGGSLRISLTNSRTSQSGTADFYTLGLTDPKGEATAKDVGGVDLRAAGVQSFAQDGDQMLVFAINSWTRYSNAASIEFDVLIDTTGDGKADKAVFSVDSGLVRAGDPDGVAEVFIQDLATGDLTASGFLAQAPTDSSTILLPVMASDLGVTATAPSLRYSVAASSIADSEVFDEVSGWANYNPWSKPINDGQFFDLAAGGRAEAQVTINRAAWAAQKPLGLMVVSIDNAAKQEAQLILVKK